MKPLILLTIMLGILGQPAAILAAEDIEGQCIAVLQSDRSPAEKDAACVQLKRVATARSVPALAALLTHEGLSHSACHALETLPGTEAAQALIRALEQTSGLQRVGIINTLGARRERADLPGFNTEAERGSTPLLVKLLSDPDAPTVTAAARALGRIASDETTKALEAAFASAAPPVADTIADALLTQGTRWQSRGDAARAFAVFDHLYKSAKTGHTQASAYRGMILASSDKAPALIKEAIAGEPGPAQMAALQLIPTVSVPGVAELLPRLTPATQIALMGVLSQRNDATAAPAIAALSSSPEASVREAACRALGVLGGPGEIQVLANAAATENGAAQKAARAALLTLRQGNPTDAMVDLLPKARPAVQVELARALGLRANPAALPKLLELARTGDGPSRSASLQALGMLAEGAQLPDIVGLVTAAKEDAARAEAANTVNVVCEHIQSRQAVVPTDAILNGMNASPEARIALLRVCSILNHPQVRESVRAAVVSNESRFRNAGIRSLCETRDPELLPDLVKIATLAPEAEFRSMAARGIVRLTTQEESVSLSNPQKLAPLGSILASASTADLKQTALSGLGEIPDVQSLNLILPLLADANVKAEAAAAAIKVAAALSIGQPSVASEALQKALAVVTNPAAREEGEKALRQIEAMAAYITQWQVSGPYFQDGQNCEVLFDTVFPPEPPGAADVKWQLLPAATEPARPWLMDILKALGGQQRVAYVRTWIHSDSEQPALLELGSDDGLKVWFNGKLLHANNAVRGLTPGSDKVNMTLNSGWNAVLLKITQSTAGWEFCARCLKPDGSPIKDLTATAEPPKP